MIILFLSALSNSNEKGTKEKKSYVSMLGNFRHTESGETIHAFKIFRVLCSVHSSEQPQTLNSKDEAGDQLPGILIFNQPTFEA